MGLGYGFVRFAEHEPAERAVKSLDGRMLYSQPMRVNWAYQSMPRDESKDQFQVFVGDLASTVSDQMLSSAFTALNLEPLEARVMWDNTTGRSRGYGFVSFKTQQDAERAIAAMNGQYIGTRRIRCGWAQHKQHTRVEIDRNNLTAEAVHQADVDGTNVYIGNLAPEVTEEGLQEVFAKFGAIAEVKVSKKGLFGFVRFERHDDACAAIVAMNNQQIGGKQVKCFWGKASDKAHQQQGMPHGAMPPGAAGMLGMGMGMSPAMLGSWGRGGPRGGKASPAQTAAATCLRD